MPKEVSFDVEVQAVKGQPVTLPDGASLADAQFLRDGGDLFLQMPDGHTVKVGGYFEHDPAPDLLGHGGGKLTPELVQAFLPPQHPGEYAQSQPVKTATDATPVGKVTEIVGDVTITRADGTKIKAALGTEVYEGDVIETSAKGGVNILFSDNTTFSISESARLSVDEFTFNSADNEGSSFFSLLQGLFVYTSGLIGKEDPGQVSINTPVGSIGIRGTVVAGHIQPEGQESTITVIDGAIVVTNGDGTIEMSDAFDTVTLTSYDTAPVDSGTMSTETFMTTYGGLQPVAGSTFDGVSSGAYESPAPANDSGGTMATPDSGGTQAAPDTGTQQTAPDGSITTTTPDSTAPTDGGTQQLQAPTQDGTQAPAPEQGSTFDTQTGQTTFGGTTTTTFSSTSTGGTGTTTTGGTAGTSDGTSQTSTQTATSSGTAGGTGAAALTAGFMFSTLYTNGTTQVSDDGIPVLGLGWPGGTVDIGTVTWQNTVNPVSVSVSGLDPSGDYLGREAVYNTATTGNMYDVTGSAGTVPIFHFDTGTNTLQLVNPAGALNGINGPYNFTVTVTDNITGASANHNFVVLVKDPGYAVFVGDVGGTGLFPAGPLGDDPINGTAGNDLIWGRDGDDTLLGLGGNDKLIGDGGDDILAQNAGSHAQMFGGSGNDQLFVKDTVTLNSPLSHFDGGDDYDTLSLGDAVNGGTRQTFDLRGLSNIVNMEEISIVSANDLSTIGNDLILNLADVFSMTDGNNELRILNTGGIDDYVSNVTVNLAGMTNVTQGGIGGVDNDYQIRGDLVSNGQTVTLIIQQGNPATDGIQITVN